MRFISYKLSNQTENKLVNTVPISGTGIDKRRKICGFALGIAIGIHIPIQCGASIAEAERSFVIDFKTDIEDDTAVINEFLIIDRTVALDMAKSIFLFRTLMSGVLPISWCGLDGILRMYLAPEDIEFYRENAKNIDTYVCAFQEVIKAKLDEEKKRAQEDFNSNY